MMTQAASYVLNIFFDLKLGLGNVPIFTLYKFEIYRIVTSLFVCSGFLSVILAYFSFLPTGKRLEYSMGSTEFGAFALTIGMMTNILYIVFAVLFDILHVGDWLATPSIGLWNILFGAIAMECTKAPQNSVRKMFVWTIPTLYYPLALFGFFSFLGGFSLAHLISVGLGYGFGHGYLEFLRISPSTCRQLEERFLQSIASSDRNYVVSSIAMGSGAWNEEATAQQADRNSGLEGLLSRWTAQSQQQPRDADVAMGSDDVSSTTMSALPTSGGHQLGGASRIQNKDPRQLRLEALERRAAANSNQQQ